MDILIEINGVVDVPPGVTRDEAADAFIGWIEENGWYLGGSCIESGNTLTAASAQEKVTAFFASQNWTFSGTFFALLETEDLLLRPAEYDDWKALYENVWRHEEVARYMLWDVTTSEEEARDRNERTIRYQQNGGLSFVVTCGNVPIGFAGIKEVSPGVYEDTGIAIGPAFQRRGYGKQVVRALTEYVFGPLGGKRFVYTCRSENTASIALQRSCGFSYTHSEERTDPRNGERYLLNFYVKEAN